MLLFMMLNGRACHAVVAAIGLGLASESTLASEAPPAAAAIHIDASRPERAISPLLYGQFLEYMFGCIKGGLHAELLRDRSFEEAPSAIGLPRYWERYPDERNDVGNRFACDATTTYPPDRSVDQTKTGPDQALRVDVATGPEERHGVYQPGVPVHERITYHGYLWLKEGGFRGRILVALEPDADASEPYEEAVIADVHGDWKRYDFALKAGRSDPLARFVIVFQGQGRLWVDQV